MFLYFIVQWKKTQHISIKLNENLFNVETVMCDLVQNLCYVLVNLETAKFKAVNSAK